MENSDDDNGGNQHHSHRRKVQLTPREEQVLLAAADGLSSTEAAKLIGISVHTVESYRRSILSKYGAKNMIEAVSMYYNRG